MILSPPVAVLNQKLYSVFIIGLLGAGLIACGSGTILSVAPSDSGADTGGVTAADAGFPGSEVDAGFPAASDAGFVDGEPVDAGFEPQDAGFSNPPAALSTRSLTSHNLGSDPGRVTIAPGRLTVDLSPIAGSTVYRATLDPYLDPERQRTARRLEVDGVRLELLAPRKLVFDATDAVRAAVEQGATELVFDMQDMAPETVSLDVLCDSTAPTALPVVENVAARHRNGDTMISFSEREPLITTAQSTLGEINQLKASVAPSVVDKTRYRIYRSTRPIDDLSDVIDAELVDEIAPLSGWATELPGANFGGDDDGFLIGMLPVDDLTPALPGTGIYVRRHSTAAASAWYLVSYVRNGAESFDTLAPTDEVAEASGPGAALLSFQETYNGTWIFTDDINMRLDYYARWSAVGEHPTPSEAYHYRVGLPLDPVNGARPGSIALHAFAGALGDWFPWYAYDDGGVMVSVNLIQYNSYTAFHEATGTLMAWDEGTAQPFLWARTLAFFFDTVVPTYNVDAERVAMFGASMGGAGTMFWGMRSGHLFAYLESSVGNSIPAEDAPIRPEFEEFGYGPFAWQTLFSNEQLARFGYPIVRAADGVSVWDYFDSRWWFANNPDAEISFMSFANAPNDGAIAWGPAWEHAQAVYEARQPHQFTWGQDGHGQVAETVEDIALRRNQAVVAFANGSLDDDLGATADDAVPEGQRNRWYRWVPSSIVDQSDLFVVDLALRAGAPGATATVDVTPRRQQQFRPMAGATVGWTYGTQSGSVTVDALGLITIPRLVLGATPTELRLTSN